MSTNNISNNDISINDLLTLEREVLTSVKIASTLASV